MVAAKKSADAGPAVEPESATAEAPEPETPVADAEAPAELPAEDPIRPPVRVVFTGQAQSAVDGMGLCDPGVEYAVPAAVADEVCRGDSPQFTRVGTA